MNFKKIGIAALGAVLLMAQATSVMADQLQEIQQRGVLRVAVPQDFPPFGSVGTDLQPQGYDIDMAQYLADKMKLKLQLVPVTSANRVPYLQTNKVDLVNRLRCSAFTRRWSASALSSCWARRWCRRCRSKN
ncbi:Cyclohexadienyl dehydratase precursor [Serratia liquefaciens]|nr:Cyclohexadienyl dehydratase precursor [Serratia liquefaciens]